MRRRVVAASHRRAGRAVERCSCSKRDVVARKRPGERSVSHVRSQWSPSQPTNPCRHRRARSSSETNASSKNTSAKPSSPSSRPNPRTVTPSVSSGTRKYVRPLCRSLSGSERNNPKRCVQNAPRVVHVFWPFSSQPPSTLVARLWMPARSLPALGSDHPWHHSSSAAAMRGRMRSCCSGRAELEHGRRQQEDAVLRDPLRTAGAVVLLLEDQPLPERRAAAAVLLGPRHDGPAVLEQQALPLEMCGESLAACHLTAGCAERSLRATQRASSGTRLPPPTM